MRDRTVVSAEEFDHLLAILDQPAVPSERLSRAIRGVPHDHRDFVEGCFRCDLSRDEC